MRGGRDSRLKSMTGREEPSGPGTLIGIGVIMYLVDTPQLFWAVVAWEFLVAWSHRRAAIMAMEADKER